MRIPKNLLQTSVANAGIAVLSAATGLLVARLLGPDDRGILATAMALFGIALALGEFGTTPGITYVAARNPSEVETISRQLRPLYRLLGFVAGCSLGAAGVVVAIREPSVLWVTLTLAAVTPVVLLVGIPNFALLGVDIVRWNGVRLLPPLMYFLAVGSLALTETATLPTVMASFVMSFLVAWPLANRALHRFAIGAGRSSNVPDAPPAVSTGSYRDEVLNFGRRSFPSTIPSALTARLDILILGLFATPAVVGTYAVAVTFASLAQPIASAIPQMVLSRMAVASSEAPLSVRRNLAWRSIGATGTIATFAAVGIALLAHPAVDLGLGSAYQDSIILTIILCTGAPAMAMALAGRNVLRGMNRPEATIVVEWIYVGVYLTLLLVLVPRYDAVGAAVASSLTSWVLLILYAWATQRSLHAQASY